MKCECGVMTNCTCELPLKMSKLQEKDVAVKFLIGLDESYSAIKSQLLLQTPFPPLSKIYSLLLQEESQRLITKPESFNFDNITMLAKNAKFYKDKKKPLRCLHCDAPGHSVDRCFLITGYPPGWRVLGVTRGSLMALMVKSPT